MSSGRPICIYHHPCADGFTAAWAIWRNHRDWEFHPATHGDPPPDVRDREVFIVDFSYSEAIIREMAEVADRVTVLDHHKTAEAALSGPLKEGVIDGQFDMNRSGARITWDWFHDELPPTLLLHVEDRDLWRFHLLGSKEVSAALFSYEYDFGTWDRLMYGGQATVLELEGAGRAIMRKQLKDIREFIETGCRRVIMGEYEVPIVNLPYFYSSEAGHLLCKGEPFAACYWDTEAGRVFSLRSTDEGADVSEIARSYGGGGHRNAAGFTLPHPQSHGPLLLDDL